MENNQATAGNANGQTTNTGFANSPFESAFRGIQMLQQIGDNFNNLNPQQQTQQNQQQQTQQNTQQNQQQQTQQTQQAAATTTTPEGTTATPEEFKPYKFEVGANDLLSAKEADALSDMLGKHKVSEAVGKEVYGFVKNLVSETVKASVAANHSERVQWSAEASKDPEIMNEWGVNQEHIKRFLTTQSPGFIEALQKSGVLNNKDVIKYFIAQGKTIADGTVTGNGTNATTPKAPLEQHVKNIYAGKM